MRRVSLTVFGRVQGVGFRYATKMVADKVGVTGLVRNLLDGTVYIEARGTDREVSDFIQAVKKGPSPYAKVTRVDLVELSDDKVYRDFAVTN
ncbi:acylphosphatase [Loigolactobacillus coryniformis]|jgi:acylphosphatase|uniref:acylphosphatase n=1 Tax=Loigolactobacillus coryniformis TaxID=1610 RepID=A0A5B8TNS4_9LACO|nr:acylphosphatase [Loigolactobacillus coryniformis]MDC4185866.1 acylphosphatase [Loigolactobacillus coryniformis]QEA53574.1 acylphosphatase [Loigolactobacillus coryniformis]RRG06832.1 MAG: acylphosphatase [Lactobacillus sp.]